MAMASRELGMELLPLTMGGRVTSSRATRLPRSRMRSRRGARLLRPTHDADIWRLSHRRRIFHSSLNFFRVPILVTRVEYRVIVPHVLCGTETTPPT